MPKGVGQPTNEPVIHVMPADFRAGKTPMTPPAAKPPAPAPLPPPPLPPKPLVPLKPLPKKKRRLSPVLIVGIVFLLVLIAVAVYVLTSLNKPKPSDSNTNTANTNTVVTPEPECRLDTDCTGDDTCQEGSCVAPPEPETPVGGTDSDSDGLTDIEEILFGSDPRAADTDRDTYLDGNEVYHLYNPRGDAPSLLTETGFAREFTDDAVSYAVVYPSRWSTQLTDAATEQVTFRVPTGEYVQIEKLSKDPAISLEAWYLASHPDERAEDLGEVKTGEGYTGLESPDKMSIYLEVGDAVYGLSYRLGEVKTINFLTTFQMMVASFTLKP